MGTFLSPLVVVLLEFVQNVVDTFVIPVDDFGLRLLRHLDSRLGQLVPAYHGSVHDDVPVVDSGGCSVGVGESDVVLGEDFG